MRTLFRSLKNKAKERRSRPPAVGPHIPADSGYQTTTSSNLELPQAQSSPLDSPSTSSQEHTTQSENPSTGPQAQDDLWLQTYAALSAQEKESFAKLLGASQGQGDQDGHTTQSPDVKAMFDDAKAMVQQKQTECEEQSWRIKHLWKDGEEIILRDQAAVVLAWITKAGDLGIKFAPSLAQDIWPCITALLQIPAKIKEHMAVLLQITETVTRVIARGLVFEECYTKIDASADAYAVRAAHLVRESLIGLYTAAIRLLCKAANALDHNSWSRIVESILHPKDMQDAQDCFSKLEQRLASDAQVGEAASAHQKHKDLVCRLQQLDSPILRIDRRVDDILQEVVREKELKQLHWLSTVPYSGHHKDIVEHMLDNTCSWILEHEKFQEWESSSGSALMWLQGTSGTGKTFLTAKVVQHKKGLLAEPNNHHEGLAFFYFNRNDATRTTAQSCLGSLLRQLSKPYGRDRVLRAALSDRIERFEREAQNRPSCQDCKQGLMESCNIFPKTTVIIDALDECDGKDRSELVDILDNLMMTSACPVKVFISGRPDGDISDMLKGRNIVKIGTEDNQNDIAEYISAQMEKTRNWDDELKKEVRERLLEKSGSMFRWTELQIKHLVTLSMPNDIRAHLGKLSEDLTAAYDEIFTRQITAGGEEGSAVAKRALMWVLAAKRPLAKTELLCAVRINPVEFIKTMVCPKQEAGVTLADLRPISYAKNAKYVDEQVTEEVLLKLCANLLTLNSSTSEWQFCHASVSEYFEAKHFSVLQAHSHLGAASLVLCIDLSRSFESNQLLGATLCLRSHAVHGSREASDENLRFYSRKIFSRYCLGKWHGHLKMVEDLQASRQTEHNQAQPDHKHPDVTVSVNSLENLLRSFLGHPDHITAECQWWAEEAWLGGLTDRLVVDAVMLKSAIYIMVHCGIFSLLKDWWESLQGPKPLFDIFKPLVSLLADACHYGRISIVKALVEAGLCPNGGRGRDEAHLAGAALSGHCEICKLILDTGKCDTGWPRPSQNPLSVAVSSNSTEMVQYLISMGANPNIILSSPFSNRKTMSVLAMAALKNNVNLMRILVEEGKADPDAIIKGERANTASSHAAKEHKFEALEYLIRNAHVDPNPLVIKGHHISVLRSALTPYKPVNVGVLRRLADCGIDLLRTFGNDLMGCDSALELFAWRGNFQCVQSLVKEHGANVNQTSEYGDFGCALIAGIVKHRLAVVSYLIKAGADINLYVPNGEYHTPLAAAIIVLVVALNEESTEDEWSDEDGGSIETWLLTEDGITENYGSAQDDWSINDYRRTRGWPSSEEQRHKKYTTAVQVVEVLVDQGARLDLKLLRDNYYTRLQRIAAGDEELRAILAKGGITLE